MLDSSMDRLFQNIRTKKVLSKLEKGNTILDIGCNENELYFNEILKYFKNYIGLDIRIPNHNSMSFVRYFVKDKLPFKKGSFDAVSMMAVFEHLESKEAAIKEIYRILKKNGRLIMTVPSPKAGYVIRLLAFFKLISKELADEHKNLMNKHQIRKLLVKTGFRNVEISKFEFGLNYLIYTEK